MSTKQNVTVGVAALAILAVAGCTAAKSAPPTRTQTLAGNTHLTDYAANTDGPTSTVILTGAIGDYGTATSVHPDGSVDPGHTSQLKLSLAHGTLRISIADLQKRLRSAFQEQFPTSAATCSGTVTATASAPVVVGSGTGAYAHASGAFSLTVTVDEVDAKPHCDGTGAFLGQTILITGPGNVSLG